MWLGWVYEPVREEPCELEPGRPPEGGGCAAPRDEGSPGDQDQVARGADAGGLDVTAGGVVLPEGD
jgi:hypothetical protein